MTPLGSVSGDKWTVDPCGRAGLGVVLTNAQAMNSTCSGSRIQAWRPPGWPVTSTSATAT